MINYVFDGQHTIEAVALVSNSRETPVWCMIYDHLCYEHEAHIFAEQQKHHRSVAPYDTFNAHLESGSEKHVYISAKGVKYLVFIPTYNNHLNKDDLLYISYDTPIVPDTRSPSGKWLHGYAHILYGGIVSDYLKAVAKYSRYDVKPIQKQIEEKSKWYHSNYEF
jgi:hypothetical protein